MSWADLFLGGQLTAAVSGFRSADDVATCCDSLPDEVLMMSVDVADGLSRPAVDGCLVRLEPVVETIKVLDADRFVTATLPREYLRRADFPLTCARTLLRAASMDPSVSTPEHLLDAVLRRASSISPC